MLVFQKMSNYCKQLLLLRIFNLYSFLLVIFIEVVYKENQLYLDRELCCFIYSCVLVVLILTQKVMSWHPCALITFVQNWTADCSAGSVTLKTTDNSCTQQSFVALCVNLVPTPPVDPKNQLQHLFGVVRMMPLLLRSLPSQLCIQFHASDSVHV